ncbi:LysE family translocator [Actinacidiphila sp. ITFR-21]|uniref:LysE family translocator n=1 Tax=Actinacidiphila sp. ITFR-21 TaxID=3075199 RepID=UPI00288A861F|nr:LysE family translocator [Streptomyces sp. ITFR-21]WNI18018.1 LysE family translocator [Streptomyces sp. ITFR-21]
MGISLTSYVVFVAAVLVICITPGPDMLYILTHGISQGTRAGLLSAVGMAAGMACHTAAVALGVATLVQSSTVAYEVLRYAGAAYLLYLAWQSLRDSSGPDLDGSHEAVPLSRVFRRAAITNLLNPKIVLFYLAFLPQFVSTGAGRPGLQLLVLGLTFTVLGLLVDCLIALLSGQIGARLRKRPGSGSWLNRLAGIVFIGLAAKVAIA